VDFSLQLSGKEGGKVWLVHSHLNTTATRGFRHQFGHSFTSDTVFVGLLREGEILLFVRSWMPHSLMYMEPDAWAVNGKVNFGRELTHALFSPSAMASRRGSESTAKLEKYDRILLF
jgi:hypothetical protein